MNVRAATPEDAAAVAEIGRVAFPPTYAGSLDPGTIATVVDALYTDGAAAAGIEAAQRNPDSRFLVVEDGDTVQGFLHYDELGAEPELHRIYLRPQAIGTGAGSMLMGALHESLPPGKRYVLLVGADNTRAIAFYRRHGLEVREDVDAVEHYRINMGVDLPPGTEPYPAHIMQWSGR